MSPRTKESHFNSLFILAFCISIYFTDTKCVSADIFPRVGVRITNTLSNNTLDLHCKSKDNDLGPHQLNKFQYVEWRFFPNLFGRTLFWCNFQDGFRKQGIDVYNEKKYGGCPVYHPAYSVICYWEVRDDGFYFNHYNSPNPPIPWKKMADWS